MTRAIRVGTRGSALALWQAGEVAARLRDAGRESEIVVIQTTGDKRQDVPLSQIGGKGLFVKELEEALAAGRIDLAVHSLKDVPSILHETFALESFLERADPRDAWIQRDGVPPEAMPPGSRVGTTSPRRRAQLLSRFPHLAVVPIRGNVDTRLAKMRAGECDALMLAAAGIERLGRTGEITSRFDVDAMVPAAGQGIIAIEAASENREARAAAQAISVRVSEEAARCERGVLHRFGTRLDCDSSIAVHARTEDGLLVVRAFVSDREGRRCIRARRSGSDPASVIDALVEELMSEGALELLA